MAQDVAKAAIDSAMGGWGISSGGGDITPDLSAKSGAENGNNSLGGFQFGNYSKGPNYTPWIIGVVILAVLWYMAKGKKRR